MPIANARTIISPWSQTEALAWITQTSIREEVQRRLLNVDAPLHPPKLHVWRSKTKEISEQVLLRETDNKGFQNCKPVISLLICRISTSHDKTPHFFRDTLFINMLPTVLAIAQLKPLTRCRLILLTVSSLPVSFHSRPRKRIVYKKQ